MGGMHPRNALSFGISLALQLFAARGMLGISCSAIGVSFSL